jgi:hypothetical protein
MLPATKWDAMSFCATLYATAIFLNSRAVRRRLSRQRIGSLPGNPPIPKLTPRSLPVEVHIQRTTAPPAVVRWRWVPLTSSADQRLSSAGDDQQYGYVAPKDSSPRLRHRAPKP